MTTVDQLLAAYPNLDHMMAETILKLHEAGRLEEFIDENTPIPSVTHTVQTGVVVAEEKCVPADKCEDSSPN